jgi:pimeloyl-ACP methyl ester carboxylesterase
MVSKNSTLFRYLLCLFGILMAMPALALTTLALVTPITISGMIYLLGGGLMTVGLILAPWRRKYSLALMVSGVMAIVGMAGVRLSLIQDQTSNVKVIVLPSGKETRWVNWLMDEQDSVLFGEEVFYRLGGVTAHEHDNIIPALSTAYATAKSTRGVTASPFLSTSLGFQNPTAFDAIVIEPRVEHPSPFGVVFLHGFMGNVAIQCWQIAQAASQLGAVTVCPSTSWIGDWWTPDGKAIIQTTLSYLRERGIQRLYLGGYSNGGNGIGSLISELAAEPGLRGLFFIAGVRDGIGVRDTHLPVLVIQGSQDERMPVEAARQFVGEVGPLATYVELEADHFLIMKQPQPVQAAISHWLEDQESDK